MKAIIIAGASSSSGKTLISCGLLRNFRNHGFRVCAYKVGPDYIDTEYLRRASKSEAYNLDTWLMSEEKTRELFLKTSRGHDIAIIEGVMGLYDGGENSTARIAKLLNIPVVLVINAKSLGESAAAIALGFRSFDSEINIAGVILNCVGSDNHAKIIADSLAHVNIKFLGALPRDEKLKIPERHLGLLPALENELDFDALTKIVERNLKLSEILQNYDFSFSLSLLTPHSSFLTVKIAIAKDEAFSFYYPESIETLRELGAQIIFFSPLRDKLLPEADAYIFGGGFPEIFARELSENLSFLESLRSIANTKKILAECGGFMYLCKTLENLNHEKFKMAGLLPFDSLMTEKPVIGYMQAKALRKNLLCEKDSLIRAHEFHYSRIAQECHEDSCAFEITRNKTGEKNFGGFANKNILASYLHINFFGNIKLAENFLKNLL